jgi:hypothetical protein
MNQSTIRQIGNIIALRNGLKSKNYLPRYRLAFSLYLIKYLVTVFLLLILSFSPLIGFIYWIDYLKNKIDKVFQFPIAITSLVVLIAFLILLAKKLLQNNKRTGAFKKSDNKVKILWVVIRTMPKYKLFRDSILDNHIKEGYQEIKDIVYDDLRKSGKKTPDEINAFIMELRNKNKSNL